MKNNIHGRVDYSALKKMPELHEQNTAEYFKNKGFNVVFIKPSNIRSIKNPDFMMVGKAWETKSPIVYSESSFEDNFKKAMKQSGYIIFDLRRLSKWDEKSYIKNLKKRSNSKAVKTLLVISRSGKVLTIKGKFVNM